jgi:hypothetical protein
VNREPGRATCGKMPAPVPLAVAARADLATSARKAWVRRRGLPCSRGDSHSSRLAAQTPGRCRQNRAEAGFERRVARRNFVFALGCGRSCDAREGRRDSCRVGALDEGARGARRHCRSQTPTCGAAGGGTESAALSPTGHETVATGSDHHRVDGEATAGVGGLDEAPPFVDGAVSRCLPLDVG